MIRFWLSWLPSKMFYINLDSIRVSTLQERAKLMNVQCLSTTEWFLVVWWSVFWTWSLCAKRATSSPPMTSTPRCQTSIYFWDKELQSKTHSKCLWKSILRRLRTTLIQFAREFFPAFWTMTIFANLRKRKRPTRTRCQRESSIFSRERLRRRWWQSRNKPKVLAKDINLQWSPSEVPPSETIEVYLIHHSKL